MRKYQKMIIDWPSLCIGCGTDQNLVHHERKLVKVNRGLRGAYQGPLTKQAQLYLCSECSENAQHEQKKMRDYGIFRFIISTLLAFMGALLIGFIFETLGIVTLLFSMMIFSWFPLMNCRLLATFRNRHLTESYYYVKTEPEYASLYICFRNREYTDGFEENNTDILADYWPSLRIAAKTLLDRSNCTNFVPAMIFGSLLYMIWLNLYDGIIGAIFHVLWIGLIFFILGYHQSKRGPLAIFH